MSRMKTFGIYLLCIIAFYIFSNVMIDIGIKTSYMPINVQIVNNDNIKVNVSKAEATYVNGYVEGNIENVGSDIEKKYVKIDLYSKRDVKLGTKYVIVDNLKQSEIRNFKMGFKLTDVDYCKVEVVDEIEANATEDEFESIEFNYITLLTTVVLLCYFG